jgi:hypothetical protein
MTYYIGTELNLNDILGDGNPRYFYSLRRSDPDGTIYFDRIDQLNSSDTLQINVPGAGSANFENFEYGVDFFDGRLAVDHTRPYPNLYFDQYRWDNKNCYYYIDASGQLVVRINQPYTYSQDQIV